MRTAACLLLLLIVVFGQIPVPQTRWFTQTLDHFNFQTSPPTFDQRYLYMDDYWTPLGPIFFYTGNEGDITEFYENSGYVFELAQEFGALVVFAEHRYYGETLPFGLESFDRDNVGYLSVEQALSDYLVLINFLNPNATLPVVTFGGSYGGSLSAYMRMRFPQAVDASLAASAPILLYDGETDSNAFFALVTKNFADNGCENTIRKAFQMIQDLANQQNYKEIAEGLNLCTLPTNQSDVDNINYWIRNAYVFLAMLDYPYPTNFGQPLPAWPVNASCGILNDESLPLLERVAQTVGLFYNGTFIPCFNITAEFFQCADASGCGGARNDPESLAWDYEACTEVIHNIGTNGETDMFPASPWSLDELSDYCENTWGVTPRPHWLPMNTNLGSTSRIIFSNGNLDPWRAGGVRESISDSVVAIEVVGGAHHLDLRSSNPADPATVTAARLREKELIEQWLMEIYNEKGYTIVYE